MKKSLNLLKAELKTFLRYFIIYAGISIILGTILGLSKQGVTSPITSIRASIGGLIFLISIILLITSATVSLAKTKRLGEQFAHTRKDIILTIISKDILSALGFGLIAYWALYILMPRPLDQSEVFYITRMIYDKFKFNSLADLLLYFLFILTLIDIICIIFYLINLKDASIYALQGAAGYLLISSGNFIKNTPSYFVIIFISFVLTQILRTIVIKKVDSY